MSTKLFMIVEHFKNDDPLPVYRRLHEEGRMTPRGLTYLSSWVDRGFGRCFQVMQTSERALLDLWIRSWSDLVEVEVYEVMTAREAAGIMVQQL